MSDELADLWQPTNVMSAALRRSYPFVYWIRVLDLPSTERIIYGGRLHFAPSVIKRPIGLCACFFLSLLPSPARKRVSSFDVRPLTLKHILRKFLQRCMPKLNVFQFGVKHSKMEQNTSGFYLNVILLVSHSKDSIDFSNLTCFHQFYKYIKLNI